MNLSDEDRSRLDKLAALRDAGDITNEEYQRLCWATIRERGIKHGDYSEQAFLEAAEEHDVFRPEDYKHQQSQAETASAFTTRTPSRMQQYQRTKRYSGRNTGVDTNLTMSRLLKRFSGGRTTANHSMLFPKRKISPLLALLVIGITISATIYIGQHKNYWFSRIGMSNAPLTSSYEYSFIKPFFGAQAVSQCKQDCASSLGIEERKPCQSACRYLSLANYGRRITIESGAYGVEYDLKKIRSQCLEQEIDSEAHRLDKEWQLRSRNAVEAIREANSSLTLGDFKAARLRYLDTIEVNKKLMMPPSREDNASQLTINLLRATCLRAHLTLAEMALSVVKNNSDKYSEDYYSKLWRSLEQTTVGLEKKVLSNPLSTKLTSANSGEE